MVKRTTKSSPGLIISLNFHRSFQTLRLASGQLDRVVWLLVDPVVETFGDLIAQIMDDFGMEDCTIGLYDRNNIFISPNINIRMFLDYLQGDVEPIMVRPYICTRWERLVLNTWDILNGVSTFSGDAISALACILFIFTSILFLLSVIFC